MKAEKLYNDDYRKSTMLLFSSYMLTIYKDNADCKKSPNKHTVLHL